MSHRFADHFSRGSSGYAAFRPRYPEALFAWLAAASPARDRAWDCATGTGQAATGLARHFAQVVATDASEGQIGAAEQAPGIEYRVAPADASGIEAASVDLVTVAQALHWLPLDRFYPEVTRVLRSGGLLAVWGYSLPTVSPAVDRAVRTLHTDVVGPYWPPGREMVDAQYRPLPFPYAEVAVPPFAIEQRMGRDRFVGYLRTWSAVVRFADAQRMDPLATVMPDIEHEWPADDARLVRWPLFVRAGHRA
jgi:SAM-dependent methyltransferase